MKKIAQFKPEGSSFGMVKGSVSARDMAETAVVDMAWVVFVQ